MKVKCVFAGPWRSLNRPPPHRPLPQGFPRLGQIYTVVEKVEDSEGKWFVLEEYTPMELFGQHRFRPLDEIEKLEELIRLEEYLAPEEDLALAPQKEPAL